jgi:hypothetical protein
VRFLGTIVTNLLAQIPRSTHLVVQALHDGGLREGAEVVLLDVDFVERLGVVLFAVLYVEGLRHREAPYRHFEVAERHLLAQFQDHHVHQIGVSTFDRLDQSWRVFRQFQQQLDLLARLGLVVQQFNGEFSAAELRRGARDLAVRDPGGVSQLLGDLSGHGLFLQVRLAHLVLGPVDQDVTAALFLWHLQVLGDLQSQEVFLPGNEAIQQDLLAQVLQSDSVEETTERLTDPSLLYKKDTE